MKNYILLILVFLFSFSVKSQVYNPTNFTVSNKSYGLAQAAPTDARSEFFDGVNFVMRPYQSTTEVKTYLNLAKYRAGNFIIVVDSGGVLNPNGTYTGGVNTFWMFKDGVGDGNLVELNLFGGGSSVCSGCLLSVNNLSDVANVATSRTNLGLGSMALLNTTAGGDLSGTYPNPVVVRFNGLPPSYYTNYANLTNTPFIPAQFNLIAGTGISLSGTYPNITVSTSGSGSGFNTAGVYLISSAGGSTVNLDTANYRKVDSLYGVNDSTINYVLNGVTHSIQIKGGVSGGGLGTGTVTNFSFVNANGISGSVTNPTSIPALTLTLGNITPTSVNGLTFSALSVGFTVSGGTTSKTLTVPNNATVSGTNTGDVTLAGETYLSIAGQVITANPVNVSGTNITGVLKASAFPAQTGDVTNSSGSLATTISANVVTNAKLAQMTSNTLKGNNTGGTANALDLSVTQVTAMLNTFTTTLKGLVPAPGSVAGKVLSDAGTWVVNGTGNTNTNVGAGYRWAIPGSNQIKTVSIGYGILVDSSSNANSLTILVDTNVIAPRGLDTIFVKNAGASGLGLGYVTGADTIYMKKLVAGANIILAQNADSSITITGSGGSGGGISLVGTINSQAPSANGLVISGSTIYTQYATPTNPGMLSTIAQSIAGVKTFSSAPVFSTLTTNGGIFFGNSAGTLLQTGAGTSVQVLHGGTSPIFGAVVLTTDVSGLLPIANGGTGTSTPSITGTGGIIVTGTWPNQNISVSGVVTSVGASGGTTGLSFSGSPITSSGTFTLSGTLVVSNGGSGLSSLTPYALMAGGSTATGTMQQVSGTGTAGQALLSNGTGSLPSWANLSAASVALPSTQIAFGNVMNVITGSPSLTWDGTTMKISNIKINSTAASIYINTSTNPTATLFNNTVVGSGSYRSSATGSANSVFGSTTFSNATSGSFNASFGSLSLNALNTGNYNTAFGSSVLTNISSGSYNIGIGINSGIQLNGASSNDIVIGIDSSASLTVTSNFTFVGNGYKSYRTNSANFGRNDQLIRFGDGGGNTTKVNSLNTHLAGDVYYFTDSNAYCMWNGSVWVRWGGSGGGGGGSQTLQQTLAIGSALSGTNLITTGSGGSDVLSFSGLNPVVFQNGASVLGFLQYFVRKTANYTLTTTDDFVEADPTGGPLTMTVPSGGQGQTYTIKKSDNGANAVTVVVNGGGTIDGASSYVLSSAQQAVTVVARGNGNYDVGGSSGSIITDDGAYHTVTSLNDSSFTLNRPDGTKDTIAISVNGGPGSPISGTFTPTFNGVNNVTSTTAHVCNYIRVGNIVTLTGVVYVNATLASTTCILQMSLPVASDLTTGDDASGTVTCYASGGTTASSSLGGGAVADPSTDRINLAWVPPANGVLPIYFSLSYKVN